MLSKEIAPTQARVALTRVIGRGWRHPARGTTEAGCGSDSRDTSLGWVKHTLTGSLYLCSVALLPLEMPTTEEFWAAPAVKDRWEKIWAGDDLQVEKAINRTK